MEDKSVIIDTNILLYLNTDFAEISEKVYAKYAELKYADFSFYVSEQIIREFIVAKSNLQKIKNQIDISQLFSDLEFIRSHFSVIFPDNISTEVLFNMLRKYQLTGKKIHDANIVAVCIANRIKHIFTNNVKDFSICEGEGITLISV